MGDCFSTVLLILGILFGVMIAIGCLIELVQYLNKKNKRELEEMQEQKRKEEHICRQNELRQQKEKEEAQRQKENQLRIEREKIKNAEAEYENAIKSFEKHKNALFSGNRSIKLLHVDVETLDGDRKRFSNNIMYELFSGIISRMKDSAKLCEKGTIDFSQYEEFMENFKRFVENMNMELNVMKMVSLIEYGKIDIDYYNRISSLNKIYVENYLSKCENFIKTKCWEEIWNINAKTIVDCLWYYAINKPFSSEGFKRVRNFINNLYIEETIQVNIAEMFAINQMGAKNILRDKINIILQNPGITSFELNQLASSLMCMKAYDEELIVLTHMASNSFQMSAKLQERLYMLSNGGGKLPVEYDVSSSGNDIYADISSLSWNEEEYKAFFDSLSFQDKSLSYSLVLRDSNKDLLLSKDFVIPKDDLVCKKISELFQEEYGNDVIAKKIHLNALSGEDVEKMDGILAKTNACKHLGVFVHIARIGKKLNIKFYTLYMPEKEQLSNQKQKAMSIYRKINPVVEMWETGMMETILLAIQRILNTSSAPTTDNGNNNTEVEF